MIEIQNSMIIIFRLLNLMIGLNNFFPAKKIAPHKNTEIKKSTRDVIRGNLEGGKGSKISEMETKARMLLRKVRVIRIIIIDKMVTCFSSDIFSIKKPFHLI